MYIFYSLHHFLLYNMVQETQTLSQEIPGKGNSTVKYIHKRKNKKTPHICLSIGNIQCFVDVKD